MSSEHPESEQDASVNALQRAYFRDKLMEHGAVSAGDDPDDPERLAKIAATWVDSATFEHECGAYAAAENQCLAAVRIWEALIQNNRCCSSDYRRQCASAYHNLGTLGLEHSDFAGAASWFQKGIQFLEQLVREESKVHEHFHELAGSINDLGLAKEQLGHIGQARSHFKRSLEIWDQLAREYPSIEEYQASHLKSRINMERFQIFIRRLRFLRHIGGWLIASSILLGVTWVALGKYGWLIVLASVVFVLGVIACFFGIVKDDGDEAPEGPPFERPAVPQTN